jgi:isopentenyldiphosphate isomerase
MVDSISFSSTEVPKCLLTTRQTKYSVCVFFKDVVLAASKDATPRENDKKKILQLKLAADFLQTRTPKFPNSLCLHCVVVTSDDMVLVARRSSHLEYYPDAWSCSFEENLAEKDFSGVGSPTENWVERSLHEEIGLQKGTDYDMGDARILSVFLEAEPGILNVNLCGLVRLKLSSSELSELLSGRIRPDYEFSSWRYLSVVEDLPEELRNPSSGTYHPTSMYRMYLTLAWYYGKQLYDSGRSPSPKAPDL